MKVIELFAGIGGFRYGLEQASDKFEFVFVNEWEEKPRRIYAHRFGTMPDGRDIRTVRSDELPDADLIVGGFPCATFSIAGKRTGFSLEDARGTLCFEMLRIARDKRIPYVLFENVKGLLNHDSGRTFATILCALDEMGYNAQWELLDSQNFGVPQHRERVFLVASVRGKPVPKIFPLGRTGEKNDRADCGKQEDGEGLLSNVSPTLDAHYYKMGASRPFVDHSKVTQFRRSGYFRDYKSGGVPTLTANMGTGGNNVPFICKPVLTPTREEKRQNGRRFKEDGEPAFTLGVQDRHGVLITDGKLTSIRKLTPLECERLQGLPDDWTKYLLMDDGSVQENSDSDRYERCGRTVTSTVIKAIGRRIADEIIV